MKTLFIFFSLLIAGFTVASGNDSIAQLIKTKNIKELPAFYNDLSLQYREKGDMQNALHWAEKAKLAAGKVNDTVELYNAYLNLSDIESELSKLSLSIQDATEALKLARTIKNARLKARAYNQLGVLYMRIPAFEKALFNHLQSLRLIEDSIKDFSNDKRLYYKALVLNNIGSIYSKMNQLEKGLEYRTKALAIRRQLSDTAGIASCLQNIGVIYEKKNDLDSAYTYYSRALRYRKILGKRKDIAELFLNIAIIKMKTGDYSGSEKLFLQAIQIFETFQDYKLLSNVYSNLANLYLKENRLSEMYQALNKSLLFAKKSSNRIVEKNAYALFSDYYARLGKYKMAWENQKRFQVLNDSIFNMQMADKIANIQNRYEIDKREKEILILRKDNEINALKVRQKSIINLILIILLILIFLLLINALFILNRRKLKQRQMEVELEKSQLLRSKLQEKNLYQNRQLITHAMNMLQKNKLLLEMDESLARFSPKADEALRKQIHSFRRQIKRSMSLEKDWEMFKMYFEQVNKSFYDSLRQKSAELTPGDLKLAALIKLNLNIKEAAAVLNISPESLRKARYRLRKKLHLKYGDSLPEYLNNL